MPTVAVSLNSRSYDVHVEDGLISRAGEMIKAAGLTGKAAIITDTNVALHYAEAIKQSLADAGFESSLHLVPPGEASKSMENVERLCRSLIEHHHDRQSFVVTLGGGVVGDLGGFVAAIFFRGIPFVQIPTTIVAQVDSAVGGKTGVNTPEGKNLLGAFHQPRLVLADPETLTHLPPRVFREGFAEVIKHAAIRDAAMLDEIEQLDITEQKTCSKLLARNAAIKARIVEEDEHETSGTRALLNFGHTIGHAIEAAVPYGSILHGEAIALGMRAALFLSEKLTGLSSDDSERILKLLEKFKLPLTLDADISDADILACMSRDKKFVGGKRRFVLLENNGNAVVSDKVTEELIQKSLNLLRTSR
jgi:3-dehydroquinate synthase